MRVYKTELPGVGTRYTMEFDDDQQFIVVLHNGGMRETHWKPDSDADSERLFQATESEARKIAEIFDGTYFHPVDEDLDEVFEKAHIKWIDLSDETSLIGETLGEARSRSQTGVSILAIQRGETTISNPSTDARLEPGDVLVVVATDEQHDALENLLAT